MLQSHEYNAPSSSFNLMLPGNLEHRHPLRKARYLVYLFVLDFLLLFVMTAAFHFVDQLATIAVSIVETQQVQTVVKLRVQLVFQAIVSQNQPSLYKWQRFVGCYIIRHSCSCSCTASKEDYNTSYDSGTLLSYEQGYCSFYHQVHMQYTAHWQL